MVATPTSGSTAEPSPSLEPTSLPTPTPSPPLAILLASPGSDPGLVDRLQSVVADLAAQTGIRWELRSELTAPDITPEVRLVIALPPSTGLNELAVQAPHAQFLAIGVEGTQAGGNLSLIEAARPDQVGFMAGLLAAIITPDWRVGVISRSDTLTGQAARQGFLTGAVYFCGVCSPVYPPYHSYPLYVELPGEASSADWQAAANSLIEQDVETLFWLPEAGDEAMLETLAQAGVKIISSGTPPPVLRSHWVASLDYDLTGPVAELWPQLLGGQGGRSIQAPLAIEEVNQELLSTGRQILAEEIMADLIAGYIDTGVDPSGTENR